MSVVDILCFHLEGSLRRTDHPSRGVVAECDREASLMRWPRSLLMDSVPWRNKLSK